MTDSSPAICSSTSGSTPLYPIQLAEFTVGQLFYTCGTAIPCHITISCDKMLRDIGAFTSTPEGQNVNLVRRVAVLEDPGVTLGRELFRLARGSDISDTSCIGDSTGKWNFIEDVVGSCIFWRQKDVGPELTTTSPPIKYVYQLSGEIHLDKDLIPSFNAVILSVQVGNVN